MNPHSPPPKFSVMVKFVYRYKQSYHTFPIRGSEFVTEYWRDCWNYFWRDYSSPDMYALP